MEITLKKTNELNQSDWKKYIDAFNTVFEKSFSFEFFQNKYEKTIKGYSYHSFLTTEDNQIVGGCTTIPFSYNFGNEKKLVGLVVDVFVLKEHRRNPYALLKMYQKQGDLLREEGITMILGVPNDVAYPYWKKLAKWKDIGSLTYYVMPVKIGNVIGKKSSLLNFASTVFTKSLTIISTINPSKEKACPISIDRSESIIEQQRYNENHELVDQNGIFFSFRIEIEKGIRTCYLIDFYSKNSKQKTAQALRKAISYITKNTDVDIIIYVGKLNFFQTLLFKVPKSKEPKTLPLTNDVLLPNEFKDSNFISDIKNWDFGLFNYDVR